MLFVDCCALCLVCCVLRVGCCGGVCCWLLANLLFVVCWVFVVGCG